MEYPKPRLANDPPADDETVLCYSPSEGWWQATYSDGEWFLVGREDVPHVTHWMFLPPSPE